MFVFKLKKAKDFSVEENIRLRDMVSEYEETEAGSWLKKINWRSFDYKWCDMGDGIIGAFSIIYPKSIFLMSSDNLCLETLAENPYSFHFIEMMGPTIIHELTHAYQWQRSKILFILGSIPIVRQFALEKEANRNGNNSEDFFKKRSKDRTLKSFHLRRKNIRKHA